MLSFATTTILLLGLTFYCLFDKKKITAHSRGRPSRSDFVQCDFVEEFLEEADKWISGEKDDWKNLDCIIIDEAQFLTKEQVDKLALIVDSYDLPVMCYGLRTDFMSNLFPGSKRLMEIADKIEEVPTVCWCGRRAHFNARVVGGKIVREGEQVMLGGDEAYISVCRRHFRSGEVSGVRERDIDINN